MYKAKACMCSKSTKYSLYICKIFAFNIITHATQNGVGDVVKLIDLKE